MKSKRSRQTQRLAHALDPGDPLGARTRSRHAQHALGGIDAGHGKAFLGDPARQQPGAAAEVEHARAALQRPASAEVEVVADVPAVEVVVERGEQGILEHLIGSRDIARCRSNAPRCVGAARGAALVGGELLPHPAGDVLVDLGIRAVGLGDHDGMAASPRSCGCRDAAAPRPGTARRASRPPRARRHGRRSRSARRNAGRGR